MEHLRERFRIASAHIEDSEALESKVDGILRRNTGPISTHEEAFNAQNKRVSENGLRMYNSIDASGDFRGKQHLVELHKLGYPVIPTFTGA